jgi:hypothetical protein
VELVKEEQEKIEKAIDLLEQPQNYPEGGKIEGGFISCDCPCHKQYGLGMPDGCVVDVNKDCVHCRQI